MFDCLSAGSIRALEVVILCVESCSNDVRTWGKNGLRISRARRKKNILVDLEMLLLFACLYVCFHGRERDPSSCLEVLYYI